MMKFLPFGVCHERTSTLDNVLKTAQCWKVHGVDVDFAKERCGSGDCWGNEEIVGLAKLADVAGTNKPCNVGFHVRLPEVKGNVQFHGEGHFVTDIIVSCMHDVETTFGGYNDLVGTMQIFLP